MMYILRSCRRMPVWSCKQLLKDSAQAESKRNQKRKAEPATPDRRSGFLFFVFILSVAAAFGFTGSRVPKPESNVLPKSANSSISASHVPKRAGAIVPAEARTWRPAEQLSRPCAVPRRRSCFQTGAGCAKNTPIVAETSAESGLREMPIAVRIVYAPLCIDARGAG